MGSSFQDFRKNLLEKTNIVHIIELPQGVFAEVTVDNVILILRKGRADEKHNVLIRRMKSKSEHSRLMEGRWDTEFLLPQKVFLESKGFALNINLDPVQKRIFDKMERSAIRLGKITESSQGIIIYKTEKDSRASKYTSFTKKNGWKKLLRGSDIKRYKINWNGEYIKYGKWLWSPRDEKFFQRPKILLQAIRNKSLVRRLIAAYDENGEYYNAHNLANIIEKDSRFPLMYILAIVNSKAANFWYKLHYPNVNINPNDFRQIPIPKNVKSTDIDALIQLVKKILSLNQKLTKFGDKRTDETIKAEAEVIKIDAEIDKIVYDLYNLNSKEIKIIENIYFD